MTEGTRLYDLARVLRSKNAGPFELTIDVIFDDADSYRRVKRSGVITRELIGDRYQVPLHAVTQLVFFDPALAIKITLERPVASGDIGDTDVYGAQQHAPLIDLIIPPATD